MSIAKVFKSIINKFNKPKVEALRWPELERVEYCAKMPVDVVTISARVTVTNAFPGLFSEDYIESKTGEYARDEIANQIARELVEKDLIAIEQIDATRSDEKVYTGKIEIVSRG